MILHPGGANTFCCNQFGHDNELLLRVVGASLMYTVGSMLFTIEAEGYHKGAFGNLGLLMSGLPQSVP
jgi:hypothetical protein